MKLRTALALSCLFTLAGCGWLNRSVGYINGYTLLCVKETGIAYVQFPTGAAVLVDQEGKPQACKAEGKEP